MNTVFILDDCESIISIHATREGAEKAFKEYTEGKSQEWIDDFVIMVHETKLEDW